jgi:hypothetical protein
VVPKEFAPVARERLHSREQAMTDAGTILVVDRQLRAELTEWRVAEQAFRETEERFRNMADRHLC